MKTMPESVVNDYLRKEKEAKLAATELAKAKAAVIKYHERGYISDALTVVVANASHPNWKKEAENLARKHLTLTGFRAWLTMIAKKYPSKPIAPAIKLTAQGKELSKVR